VERSPSTLQEYQNGERWSDLHLTVTCNRSPYVSEKRLSADGKTDLFCPARRGYLTVKKLPEETGQNHGEDLDCNGSSPWLAHTCLAKWSISWDWTFLLRVNHIIVVKLNTGCCKQFKCCIVLKIIIANWRRKTVVGGTRSSVQPQDAGVASVLDIADMPYICTNYHLFKSEEMSSINACTPDHFEEYPDIPSSSADASKKIVQCLSLLFLEHNIFCKKP
jgi:hypothetical protein